MKPKLNLLYIFASLVLLTSCSPRYYQVMETTAINAKNEKEGLVFENPEVKVTYNFWSEGGQVYFIFTNNLDSSIFINWDKSHFIFNGISQEYWLNVEESNGFYTSVSNSSSSSVANALSGVLRPAYYNSVNTSTILQGRKTAITSTSKVKPKKILHIPPRSSILVSKFNISKDVLFNCDFNLKNLGNRNPRSKSFSYKDSPFRFRNYLTYSTKENFAREKTIDHEFYVSQVSFMSQTVFSGKAVNEKECNIDGNKSNRLVYPYPYMQPGAFFISIRK